MNLIKSSFQILDQESTLERVYKQIELAVPLKNEFIKLNKIKK